MHEIDLPRIRSAGIAFGATLAAWLALGAALPNGLPLGVVLLGVVLGSLEALTAMGLVLVYRAARIVNFAQADIGGLAAGVAVVLVAGAGLPYLVSLLLAVLAAATTGVLIDGLVIRRFFEAPRLILTVATVGVAQILGAGQIALPTLFDIDRAQRFVSPLDWTFRVGPILFNADHITAMIAVPAVLAGLAWFLGRSVIGIAIRAAADSTERALLLGIPVRRLSQVTWMVAAGLSGLGAILTVPIIGTNLGGVAGPASLLGPLAASVVARMERLGVAFGAALGIGVLRQVVFWNYPRATTVDVALFLVVLVALLAQRRQHERVSSGSQLAVAEIRPISPLLRGLPELRTARVGFAALLAVVAIVVPAFLDNARLVFMTNLAVFAILAVSLVVLTGWAGQVSLGQFALAGVGGAVGAGLMAARGTDFFLALLCAMTVSAGVAVLVGIPALRIPGLFFAVTTLALAVPVATWLLNPTYFPALVPSNLPRPELFGVWSLDSSLRFYYVALVGVAVAVWTAGNFRRSRAGRVILAVRDNERAASSFSIDPNLARLMAFGFSGALAGMAGLLYIVGLRAVPFNGFDASASIQLFTMVVIGGLGSIPGAILGATYVWSAQFFLRGATQLLATGAGLLLLLLFVPGGLGEIVFGFRDRFLRWVAARHDISVPGLAEQAAFEVPSADVDVAVDTADRAAAPSDALLRVDGVEAAYGKVPVLFGVDLSVGPSDTVALLGTNGAGKSTALRVIGGLLPATAGTVVFDGEEITDLDPTARVRRGLVTVPGGRGVFDSLTVSENLRVAAWVHRKDIDFVDHTTAEIIELFPRLEERRDERAASLSGGEQQMLTIAQAMLCRPKLLMIDELSLGLAPTVVALLLDAVHELVERGISVLVVEQSLNVAATLSDDAVFMERGQVRFHGSTRALLERDDLARSVFFGQAVTESDEAPTHEPGSAAAGATLEITDLSRAFGGVQALSNVRLRAEAGSILGIIGSNGAGKTTLFDHVSGFLVPDAGRIHLDGVDVTNPGAAERAALGMGRVFQDARLFPALTVRETIAVAFERHLRVRDPFAASVGLAAAREAERELRDQTSELIGTMGLDRYEDAFVSELSTGTRRVVELACAMAHRPSLLLLDEPSSGIAQRESESLAELLLQLRDRTGATFVIIEHDIPLVRSIADRLICMHLGTVLCEGEPDAVLHDPAVVSSYLGESDVAVERSGGTA